MAYEVSFSLPERKLGSADLEVSVKENGQKLGRLKVSKGSAVWVPRDKTYGYKLRWGEVAALFEEHGTKERG